MFIVLFKWNSDKYTQKKTHPKFERGLYLISDSIFWACFKNENVARS